MVPTIIRGVLGALNESDLKFPLIIQRMTMAAILDKVGLLPYAVDEPIVLGTPQPRTQVIGALQPPQIYQASFEASAVPLDCNLAYVTGSRSNSFETLRFNIKTTAR